MDVRGWGEIVFTIALTVILAWPLGIYMARVWQGERTWLDPVLRPVEGVLYAASTKIAITATRARASLVRVTTRPKATTQA